MSQRATFLVAFERIYRGGAKGVWVGILAATITALGDFGAGWLWLPFAPDRMGLLMRLYALQWPVGALLCALAFAFDAGFAHYVRGIRPACRALAWALPFTAVLTWPTTRVAYALFTGGKMSRLPNAALLRPLAAIALVLMLFFCLAFSYRAGPWLVGKAQNRISKIGLTASLLCAYFVASKADQHVLPNLYLYLHAVLGAAGFVCAAGCAFLALKWSGATAFFGRTRVYLAYAVLLALILLEGLNLATIERNQNIRVMLGSARAPTSRSLLLAFEPLLVSTHQRSKTDAAIRKAAERRASREAALRAGNKAASALVFPEAHVVIITVDALRADHLGFYGYKRPTSPHLDAWAKEGVVFEHAYTQTPHSSYSLSSLMTSSYVRELVRLEAPLPTDTLASLASKMGYHTAAFYTSGIFHTEGERLETYQRTDFGFALHDPLDYTAEEQTNRALVEVDRIVKRGEPKSLLWVHYFNVHEPYQDTYFGKDSKDRYDSEIRNADKAIARFIAGAEAKLDREIIWVLTADHGEEFGEHNGVYHGSSLYEEQVRVPLVVRMPSVHPRRISAPVELVDVGRTLLESIEVPRASTMTGDDLRPLIVGASVEMPPAFSTVLEKRMVVRWPEKLIADLRYNMYQLFDLEKDPAERVNLADRSKERVRDMLGEVYAWLDSLSEEKSNAAIGFVKLGDKRPLQALIAILDNRDAPSKARQQAAKALGNIPYDEAAAALVRALSAQDKNVASQAAITLGFMKQKVAQAPLRNLVITEDPALRVQASLALGTLRDSAAVPGLIEALYTAKAKQEREDAVRMLGWLGDTRATEPLLELIGDKKLRYLAVLALGHLGDKRAIPSLRQVLTWQTRADVRDNTVAALGMLGDVESIPTLVQILIDEPDAENTAESLVRLRALERGAVGGIHVAAHHRGTAGLRACKGLSEKDDWQYAHHAWCESERSEVTLPLQWPKAMAKANKPSELNKGLLVVSAKRADAEEATALDAEITICRSGPTESSCFPAQTTGPLRRSPSAPDSATKLEPRQLSGRWTNIRWTIPLPMSSRNPAAPLFLTLRLKKGRIALDHVIFVPSL